MTKKRVVILPLATALAALGASAAHAAAPGNAQDTTTRGDAKSTAAKLEPNVLFKVGEDLLGLVVTHNADGTVVAAHSSHHSHSSHASHRSHYSSR